MSLTLTSVMGYILCDSKPKNFKYKLRFPRDGEEKTWILVDYGRNVWRIKVVAWNDLARKFHKTLPRGTNVRISNFRLKKSSWEADQL